MFWPTVRIVIVIEKNFWNSRLKVENFQNFWDQFIQTVHRGRKGIFDSLLKMIFKSIFKNAVLVLRLTTVHSSDAISECATWALVHLDFGNSVKPIPTRGAYYAHHITACRPNCLPTRISKHEGISAFIDWFKVFLFEHGWS